MTPLEKKIEEISSNPLIDVTIGQRLKEERERLGYSQTAFAAIGNASKGAQISWEKGTAFPNADFLARIAIGVGADIEYIVTGQHRVRKIEPISDVLRAAIEEVQSWQIREERFLPSGKFVETVLTLCELASRKAELVPTAASLALKLMK